VTPPRIDRTAADQSMIDGNNKLATKTPPIFAGGVAVPTPTLVAALQARTGSGQKPRSPPGQPGRPRSRPKPMSTPVLEIWEQVLALPVVVVDS
jgi:hypothetical protein